MVFYYGLVVWAGFMVLDWCFCGEVMIENGRKRLPILRPFNLLRLNRTHPAVASSDNLYPGIVGGKTNAIIRKWLRLKVCRYGRKPWVVFNAFVPSKPKAVLWCGVCDCRCRCALTSQAIFSLICTNTNEKAGMPHLVSAQNTAHSCLGNDAYHTHTNTVGKSWLVLKTILLSVLEGHIQTKTQLGKTLWYEYEAPFSPKHTHTCTEAQCSDNGWQ